MKCWEGRERIEAAKQRVQSQIQVVIVGTRNLWYDFFKDDRRQTAGHDPEEYNTGWGGREESVSAEIYR